MSQSNKNSLKEYQKYFPLFLDKRAGSNFSKFTTVLNNRKKELDEALKILELGSLLERPISIQKIQEENYHADLIFRVNLDDITNIQIINQTSDEIIFDEIFDNESYFEYVLDYSNLEKPVNDEKYVIKVKTIDDYCFEKGYPENDVSLGDIFDHDRNLDVMGKLLTVKRFNHIVKQDIDLMNTLPPFHNKTTEDDYYYMRRIQEYMKRLGNGEALPVLDLWKYYGINVPLINRKILLAEQQGVFTPYQWVLVDEDIYSWDMVVLGEKNYIPETNDYVGVISGVEKVVDAVSGNEFCEVSSFDEININYDSNVYVGNYYFDVNASKVYIYFCNELTDFQIKVYSNNGTLQSNNDDYRKYMKTKDNYNSNVYDIYVDYDMFPENLTRPTENEIQKIILRNIPLTKKIFYNLHLNSHSNDQIKTNTSFGVKLLNTDINLLHPTEPFSKIKNLHVDNNGVLIAQKSDNYTKLIYDGEKFYILNTDKNGDEEYDLEYNATTAELVERKT